MEKLNRARTLGNHVGLFCSAFCRMPLSSGGSGSAEACASPSAAAAMFESLRLAAPPGPAAPPVSSAGLALCNSATCALIVEGGASGADALPVPLADVAMSAEESDQLHEWLSDSARHLFGDERQTNEQTNEQTNGHPTLQHPTLQHPKEQHPTLQQKNLLISRAASILSNSQLASLVFRALERRSQQRLAHQATQVGADDGAARGDPYPDPNTATTRDPPTLRALAAADGGAFTALPALCADPCAQLDLNALPPSQRSLLDEPTVHFMEHLWVRLKREEPQTAKEMLNPDLAEAAAAEAAAAEAAAAEAAAAEAAAAEAAAAEAAAQEAVARVARVARRTPQPRVRPPSPPHFGLGGPCGGGSPSTSALLEGGRRCGGRAVDAPPPCLGSAIDEPTLRGWVDRKVPHPYPTPTPPYPTRIPPPSRGAHL